MVVTTSFHFVLSAACLVRGPVGRRGGSFHIPNECVLVAGGEAQGRGAEGGGAGQAGQGEPEAGEAESLQQAQGGAGSHARHPAQDGAGRDCECHRLPASLPSHITISVCD